MTHHWMNKYELDKVIKMESNLKYENHHYTHKFIKKINVFRQNSIKTYVLHLFSTIK